MAELVEIHAKMAETDTVEIEIRCTDEGEDVIERVYRFKGLSPVTRGLAEKFASTGELDQLLEDHRRAAASPIAATLREGARRELDAINA